MKYLLEHQMGFDTNCIGFPSIQGCHAVVYQTSAGLYGFHIAGGSANADWALNAGVFRQFVASLNGLANPGTRLYGASFVGNNQRGYSPVATTNWKNELLAIASALGYTGKISGYDLFKTLGSNASAYVEYRVNGPKCNLYVRRWDANEHPPTAPNTDFTGHVAKHKTYGNPPTIIQLNNAITSVNRTQLTLVHKEKLR